MTAPIYVNVNIPFEGFYGSKYSGELEHVESQHCEYEATESEREGGELSYPEALRLTKCELAELLMRHTDYGAAHHAIAGLYTEAFDREAGERLGFPLGLRFEAMTSPREYNFQTDRIFADMPLATVRRLWAMSKADGHATLGAVIRDRFTSRSGFHSFYDNRLAEWCATPVREWDHNQLGTLLIACLQLTETRDPNGCSGEDMDWAIYYAVTDADDVYRAWDNAVDWPAFEAARDEARADKAADLAEDDPDAPDALDWRTGLVFTHPDQAPLWG